MIKENLQKDLEDAVERLKKDSEILHKIAHGNEEVATNGGIVKSAAKTISEIKEAIDKYGTKIIGEIKGTIEIKLSELDILQKGLVERLKKDSEILHKIAHGSEEVATEGGTVKSAAKTIGEINEAVIKYATKITEGIERTIEIKSSKLDTLKEELEAAVSQSKDYSIDAGIQTKKAYELAASLNLPQDLIKHAGQLLAVKADGSGYETLQLKAQYYGLRKEGSKLLLVTGDENFNAVEFSAWMISMPGLNFSIGASGHLLITI